LFEDFHLGGAGMRKFAVAAALGLMACSLALCQVKLMIQLDGRAAGTWRLESERVLAGPAIAPSVALGTITTIRKGQDGHAWIDNSDPIFGHVVLSPDGNTITGTVESPKREYYRVVRVWKRQ
jgi:hypothetical protein